VIAAIEQRDGPEDGGFEGFRNRVLEENPGRRPVGQVLRVRIDEDRVDESPVARTIGGVP
jgi:hypothetical protein